MPGRKNTKQAKHRQAVLDAGGRYLTVEIGAQAVMALEGLRERKTREGKAPSTREIVEESLVLNYARGKSR